LAFPRAPQTVAITVFEDNSAALQIANNVLDIKRSKAVDTRYHYSRENISEGENKVAGYTCAAVRHFDQSTKRRQNCIFLDPADMNRTIQF
jgi:hypothetical protein